ncbi:MULTISPECIES: hypothetical protein [unclassified Luteococcus]|uniref:hypothetical protein n=1 Tax=unclassified Luteococcus TaxID=2639923 RepID=UPI00313E5DCF
MMKNAAKFCASSISALALGGLVAVVPAQAATPVASSQTTVVIQQGIPLQTQGRTRIIWIA